MIFTAVQRSIVRALVVQRTECALAQRGASGSVTVAEILL
jgi:hypothetical protein